ncbi:acetyl-CoA carboxylase biotin carboxyl carrier protein [Paenisporosarcina sp. TG20]|uniref:acetyl-CoA carboxylase biotin carboxyl carrier protein n=1 Tax=Paenisporosarcina sp. TG20 TaxID=1211706 RepID=UPI00030C9CD7|nr:acetyl-CoA carboxylase biotin carboxyl carrier protein [Paenisporosarcina sp. TG20]
MLKVQEIREIIKLIDHSSIDEFSYEAEGSKIKLKKNGLQGKTEVVVPAKSTTPVVGLEEQGTSQITTAQTVKETSTNENVKVSAVPDESLHQILSPMVGTFYESSSPDSPAFVQVGDKVSEDGIVCIVEAMKLFNEIEAEVSGEVVEILVKDGHLVEYGQPLFLVKAN